MGECTLCGKWTYQEGRDTWHNIEKRGRGKNGGRENERESVRHSNNKRQQEQKQMTTDQSICMDERREYTHCMSENKESTEEDGKKREWFIFSRKYRPFFSLNKKNVAVLGGRS